MPQYNINNITDVYWASNEGFKSGRDPMGIQNSSVATYSVLLPGLTNLTGHIRYYSLYCWILDEYNRLDKLSPQKVHQYDFMRRFELAMAILMNGEGMRAVVGANFVYYDKNDSSCYFDYWNTFTHSLYKPNYCRNCKALNTCDASCREVANILKGSPCEIDPTLKINCMK